MSSQQRRGGLVGSLVERIVSTRSGYECGLCGLSFDSERLNCPACGGPIEES